MSEPLGPGPELDAKVAELVMNLEHRPWKPYCTPEGWYRKDLPSCFEKDLDGQSHGDPEGYYQDLPMFSTHIQDAEEVLDRLLGLGYEVASISKQSRCGPTRERLGEWGCRLEVPQEVWLARNSGSTESGWAPTLAHAICLAALRAVEAARPAEAP